MFIFITKRVSSKIVIILNNKIQQINVKIMIFFFTMMSLRINVQSKKICE